MRVLIAEDEPIVLSAISAEVRRLGHEVVAVADNGQEALRLCRDLRPDVALLDIYMPLCDGIAVARILNQEGEVPAILVTAFSTEHLATEADSAGVFGYLVKPVDRNHLGPALLLARSRFLERQALRGATLTPRAVPARLRVNCFGWFKLQIGDRPVAESEYKRHSKDLLQYLLLSPGTAVAKATLMDQLFAESDGDLANEYVNKAFGHLRKLLQEGMPAGQPPVYVVRQGDSYVFEATSPYESDLDAFRRLTRQARLSPHADEKARLYVLAAEYYVGDLFVDQPDALWAEHPREAARESAHRALHYLAGYYMKRGEKRRADDYATRLVALDPGGEEFWARGAALAEAERQPWTARTWLQRGQVALGRPTPSLAAMEERLRIPSGPAGPTRP
jgi:two-component SAPR family response regulator